MPIRAAVRPATLRIMGGTWGDGEAAERRLQLYKYLTVDEKRTYFAIMQVFTSTLLADLSAAEVAEALAKVERTGGIEQGTLPVVPKRAT